MIRSVFCSRLRPCKSLLKARHSVASLWTNAVADAEKLVGSSADFSSLSLECLLSDEISTIVVQVRKLLGTKHPILKTAGHLLYNGKHAIHARSLIVLLAAKGANETNLSDLKPLNEDDKLHDGLFQSQRTLAQIMELMYTGNLIHLGLLDSKELELSSDAKALTLGNNLAVLGGDFLLANASKALAKLGNTKVIDMFAQSLADMTEAQFPDDSLYENEFTVSALPLLNQWYRRTILGTGSLLANSCKSALCIVGHSDRSQESAYRFGVHFAIASAVSEELLKLKSAATDFDVASSCVAALAGKNLEKRPNEEFTGSDGSSDLLNEAQTLCQLHSNSALKELDCFMPSSVTKETLVNVVHFLE